MYSIDFKIVLLPNKYIYNNARRTFIHLIMYVTGKNLIQVEFR